MPKHRNTDNTEQHWLDAEDWEIALQPYQGHPYAAYLLGVNFTILRGHLEDPLTINDAFEELDRAMQVLYMHTQFHEVSYVLFRRLAEGKLTLEEEEVLKSLGIKF